MCDLIDKTKLNIFRRPALNFFFRLDDRLLLITIGALVGICSGLSSVALNSGLMLMFHWLSKLSHLWWFFVIPGIGAALSSLTLEKIFKEGAGHGVPEIVYSVSRYGGLMRLRSAVSRLISSCLTIGSGGSAGPEAPAVMSGAAIGSNIARFFSMNDRQRITLVGCGVAGGLASIFNAPIAGIVFTIEIIIGEWSAANIVPIAIASVAGAQISRLLRGNQIAFTHLNFDTDITATLAAIGLAVITAVVSIVLTRTLRRSYAISSRIAVPVWGRAAIGGCLVGIIGIFLPQVMGEGYHAIQRMVEGTFNGGAAIVALLVFAKIIATGLTLGWGGSGGIFAPCLVIGSFSGLMYYHLISLLLPGISLINEGYFALLGMAGLVSGTLQAPLTGLFLIVEITGSYEVILPLILVSTISTTISYAFEPASFYLKDLIERGHFLRPRTDAKVLADLGIREIIEKDCITVHPNMLLGEFINVIQSSHRNYFPVENEQTGEFMGMIHLDGIRSYIFDPLLYETVFLEQIMETDIDTVSIDDDLSDVLDKMDMNNLFSLPVVSSNRFIGMVSKATLLDKYRSELRLQAFY